MTCSKCGEVLAENATTCSFCGEPVTPAQTAPTQTEIPTYTPPVEEKEENVVRGTIGAMIGALLGGASIILLYQLGYVAALSGLILAFCSLKGYELLGGKLSTKGIIISIVFMVIVPAVAYFLTLAMSLLNEWPTLTLRDSLQLIFEILPEDSNSMAAVIKDLLMLYGFTALGAVSLVINAFKKKQ